MGRKQLYIAGMLGAAFCAPAHSEGLPSPVIDESIVKYTSSELKEKVNQAIAQLRKEGYSCSQATLLGLCRTLGSNLTETQIKAISSGLRGGIGRTFEDGTCGALTAGVMALGLYTASCDDEKVVALSKELFEHFKKTYGTVKCGDIVGKFKFTKCTGCCLCMGEKVMELLQQKSIQLPQAPTVAWNDDAAYLHR